MSPGEHELVQNRKSSLSGNFYGKNQAIFSPGLSSLNQESSTFTWRWFNLWKKRTQKTDLLPSQWFGIYLVTVSILNVLVTAVFLKERSIPVVRYNLLFLFFPVGMVLWNMLSSFKIQRFLGIVFVSLWSLSSVVGFHNLYSFFSSASVDERIELAKFLEDNHITYAKAPYWDAYYLTFISQERLKVSSSDHVRVEWLQDLVHLHQEEAALISYSPCPEGKELSQFRKWYICHF